MMILRKNVNALTGCEKAELVAAIKAIKASGKYDQYVLRHAQAPSAVIHRSPSFLPWHRQFILDYETDLQQASGNPNLALPYWNWAQDAALPDPSTGQVWGDDLLGGNGDPADSGIVKTGAFRQGEWNIVNSSGSPAGPLIREFGAHPAGPTLPSQGDVDNALNTTPYDANPWNTASNPSFRNRLEGWYGAVGGGLHNRGHLWVGGSMLPMTSPNDPVFFLHHCFVDKLWADWQARYPNEQYLPQSGGPPSQNLDDLMEPTVSGQVTPGDVLDHHALGYEYERPLTLRHGIYTATMQPRGARGVYTIQQKSNGRFVDAHQSAGNDFSLVTRPEQNNDTQRWIFTTVAVVCTIQQKSNGRFVDAYGSAGNDFSLVTRTAQNNDTQRWILKALGDNTYTIQQKSNGRFVDAHQNPGNDFSLVTRTAQNNDTQRWILKPLGNNTYTIQQKSGNRFVDAHESAGNDFSVVTRTAQNNDTQRWMLTLVGVVYTIQQKSNGRFVDAHEDAGNDFSLVTRTAQNNDTQRWMLTYLGNDDTHTIQQLSNGRFVDAHQNSGNDFSLVTRTAQDNETQRWMIKSL